jgi:hypothetical protein
MPVEGRMSATTVAFLTGGFVGVFFGMLILGSIIVFRDKR